MKFVKNLKKTMLQQKNQKNAPGQGEATDWAFGSQIYTTDAAVVEKKWGKKT